MKQKKLQAALATLLAVCAGATGAFAQETAVPLEGTIGSNPRIVSLHNGLTLNGAVGNVLNPTANIPNQGSYRVQGTYIDLGDVDIEDDGNPLGNNLGDIKFYGAHVNARPWSAPVEVSIGVEKLRARGSVLASGSENDFEGLDKTSASISAKWQAWRSEDGDAFVAVGAGYSRALFNNTHAYVVGTKALNVGRRPILAHLGLRYDRFEFKTTGRDFIGNVVTFEQEVQDDSSRASIFAAVEVPIDRRGRWTFAGELQSKNSDELNLVFPGITQTVKPEFPYSAAIRYANDGWAASAGVARQGVTGDSGLFAQIGKTF